MKMAMFETLLCRYDKSDVFLRSEVVQLTEIDVTVRNPLTDSIVRFACCEGQDLDPRDIDVVVDTVPSGKLVNIGCPVLVPGRKEEEDQFDHEDGFFILCQVIDKQFKPLQAKVKYTNNNTAWTAKEKMRVMQSPWANWNQAVPLTDSIGLPGGGYDKNLAEVGVNGMETKRQGRKRKAGLMTKKYKKGEILRMPHGVLKKYNGKQWRRLCVYPKCMKESQKSGLCAMHLGGRPRPKKTRIDPSTDERQDMDTSDQPSGLMFSDEDLAAANTLVQMSISPVQSPVRVSSPDSSGCVSPRRSESSTPETVFVFGFGASESPFRGAGDVAVWSAPSSNMEFSPGSSPRPSQWGPTRSLIFDCKDIQLLPQRMPPLPADNMLR